MDKSNSIKLVRVPATLKIRKNLENEFPFFHAKGMQGKLSGILTVTEKGKVFATLVYIRLVPCVQVMFIDTDMLPTQYKLQIYHKAVYCKV